MTKPKQIHCANCRCEITDPAERWPGEDGTVCQVCWETETGRSWHATAANLQRCRMASDREETEQKWKRMAVAWGIALLFAASGTLMVWAISKVYQWIVAP